MFAAFLLFSVGAAQAGPPPLAVTSPEVAAERVKACGFNHVRVKDDDELQEQVVEVTGVSTVPEAKMRCAVKVSLDTIRYVLFPPPASKAYWRLYSEMEGKGDDRQAGWMKADARDWLQQHGLFANLPTYVKGRTDDLAAAGRALRAESSRGVPAISRSCGAHPAERRFRHGRVPDQRGQSVGNAVRLCRERISAEEVSVEKQQANSRARDSRRVMARR